jgi:glycosyltransferase involved in cell wall biosynthesis
MQIRKVVIIGSAWPLRGGGITTFNHRLCKQFIDEGYDCSIFSFSLQYPSFLFPGTSQYTDEPRPANTEIFSVINSIYPINWWQVGNTLRRMKPDLVVVRYWLPLMGPAFGTILRRVKKNRHSRIIAITDNIIPHEKRPGDAPFTRYFLKSCDAFITMSQNVMNDLATFEKKKPVKLVSHPLYDNFGDAVSKQAARQHLGIEPNDKVVLLFGFIRKYKGLDLLLEAARILKDQRSDPAISRLKFLIAGEFYDDPKPYLRQIEEAGIGEFIILKNNFIPDNEVKYYFCASDAVVQPYKSATQSGVTPLAYHFEKPMIVTNVGNMASMVPDGKVGLVCEPEPSSIANAITRYFELGEQYFIPHLRSEKQKYSWHNLVSAITELADRVSPS